MAFVFGDGYDLYAAFSDAIAGYWDSGVAPGGGLVTGRFTGSRGLGWNSTTGSLTKASTVTTDPVHHVIVAFQQTAALSGTTLGLYIQLLDGTTGQCCIVFRSDGAILLTSGTPGGTVLATYTGAVTAANSWFAFEFEVVINNATGSFTVRKNGNTSNDFTLGSLNTRVSANNYANKVTIGMNAAVNAQLIDDFLWRSDAASVPWVGDIRCYTRMPASDVQHQFSGAPMTATAGTAGAGGAITAGSARYPNATTAPCNGTIGTATVSLNAGYTGNMKCAVFAYNAGAVGAVLATATAISNPVTGVNTFTFPTPATLTKGTVFFLGFCSDTSSGTWNATGTSGLSSATSYASFPVSSPSTSTLQQAPLSTAVFTATDGTSLVNETQQDGATSYVFDSTVGHNDLYAIAAITGTPTSVVAVTTRGFVEKSDAGARSGALQLKSGATTVQSTTTALGTSWGWLWRTDTTDPNTGATWTATAVNSISIGPNLIS